MTQAGFLKRPHGREVALIQDLLQGYDRAALLKLALWQKRILMAVEQWIHAQMVKGSFERDTPVLQAAQHHLSKAIEAVPGDIPKPIQERIGAWALATFGPDREAGTLAHLAREVEELRTAWSWDENVSEEAADCAILLLNFAECHGFDLLEAVERKFQVVQKRKWKAPDAEGVIEHLREGA